MEKMKKRRFTKILALLLALVMAAAVPMEAYAAKTKTVTVAVKEKKAKAVKIGTQTVKIKSKDGMGYVKFKATKKKTYKFKINNVRSAKTSSEEVLACANVSFYKKGKYTRITFKQDGKKGQSSLAVESQYSHSIGEDEEYLTSRTASIKLKKGQTIYIWFCCAANEENVLMDLTIK